MAIDTFKQEQDRLAEEARIKAGMPEAPEDMLGLKDIMDDDEQSSLLADMISFEGNIENKRALDRFSMKKTEARDVGTLSEICARFGEKMRKAEIMLSELTPEFFIEIGKKDPDLKKIIEIGTIDGVVNVVKNKIKRLAFSDPVTFEQISRQAESVKSYREGDLKKIDEEIIEKSKTNHWNADSYAKALAIGDPAERQKALVKIVKGGWNSDGFIGSVDMITNFLSLGKVAEQAAKDAVNMDDIKILAALSTLERNKANLGSVFAASVLNNQDLLDALTLETIGEPKKPESSGMKEVKEAMPTEESMKKYPEDFIQWRRKMKIKDRDWNYMDDAEKEPYRDAFLGEKRGSFESKKGMWKFIFGGFVEDAFSTFNKGALL